MTLHGIRLPARLTLRSHTLEACVTVTREWSCSAPTEYTLYVSIAGAFSGALTAWLTVTRPNAFDIRTGTGACNDAIIRCRSPATPIKIPAMAHAVARPTQPATPAQDGSDRCKMSCLRPPASGPITARRRIASA